MVTGEEYSVQKVYLPIHIYVPIHTYIYMFYIHFTQKINVHVLMTEFHNVHYLDC